MKSTPRLIAVLMVALSMTALPLFAEDESAPVDRDRQLLEKRHEVELEMHKLRLELIKTDAEISRLHERLMALHKELQIKVDSNPMMQRLIKKAEQLDREIKRTSADKK